MAITLFNALYRRLAADTATAAIVGTKIQHGIATRNTLPFVVIEDSHDEDDAIDAKQAQHYDVEIIAEAATEAVRDSLKAAIIASINRQTWTDGTARIVSTKLMNVRSYTQSTGGNAEIVSYVAELPFHIIAVI